MSLSRIVFVSVIALGCDKSAEGAKAKETESAEEGVPVAKYCKKMVALGAKAAAENGASSAGGPTEDQQLTFCTMMFEKAKAIEPKAYACMADCMIEAKTREGEQACIAENKCLAKAKNKKLFSNRTED